MSIFITATASATHFKHSLLSCVANSVLVAPSGREWVTRVLDAQSREPLTGSWSERRALRARGGVSGAREYASFLTRLNAAYYAKRSVAEATLASTFLSLVIENLRLEREPELDVLFGCSPMLEVLNTAEHAALLKTCADGNASAHERRLAIYTNATVLDRSAEHQIAIEIGQQCAAWFALRDDLSASMQRLSF